MPRRKRTDKSHQNLGKMRRVVVVLSSVLAVLQHEGTVAYSGRHYGGRSSGAMWSMGRNHQQGAKGSKPSVGVSSSGSRTQQISSSALPRMMNQQQRPPLSYALSEKKARLSQLQAMALMDDPLGINAVIRPNLQQALLLGFAAICFAQTKNAYDEKRQLEEYRRRARLYEYNSEKYLLPESQQPVMSPRQTQIQNQLMLLERWKKEYDTARQQQQAEAAPLEPWPDLTAPAPASSASTFVPPATTPAPAPERFFASETPAPESVAPYTASAATTSGSSSTKNYSMSKWSPGSSTVFTGTTGSPNSYLENMSNGAVTPAPSYTIPSAPAPAPLSSAAPSVASTPTAPPPSPAAPAPASSSPATTRPASSVDYITGLSGGERLPNKSYKMSNWSPKSRVNNAAAAGSSTAYLFNMNLPKPGVAPSYPAAPPPPAPVTEQAVVADEVPAPAPPATVPSYASSTTTTTTPTVASGAGPKKSYAMSKWSPSSGLNYTGVGGSNAYLANMSGGSTSSVTTPSYAVPDSPAAVSQPPMPATATTPSPPAPATRSSGSKKSYAMSKWSPGSSVGSSGTTGSSSSYLASMSSSVGNAVVPSYSTPKPDAPSASPPASTSGNGAPKKSYSMSKWSPGSSTGSGTAGSGSSYLSNISSGGGATPLTPPYSAPPVPAARAPAPSVAPPPFAAPATGGSSSTAKKSYSMSKWSPGSDIKTGGMAGSSSSYLSSMSSGHASPEIPSYTAPPAPTPAMPASEPVETPSSYSASASSGYSAQKKSYSVSKWSPESTINAAATSGSSGSYLANMSSGSASTVTPSYLAPPAPAHELAEPAPPVTNQSNASPTTITSNITPKKSYAMSKWSPGSQSVSTGTAGSGSSYLSNMSSNDSVSSFATSDSTSPASAPQTVGDGDVEVLESKAEENKAAVRQNFTPFGRKPVGAYSPGARSSYLDNLKSQ